MPVNYQNGKIYKIECNITNEIYIGSTCQPTLARRLTGHVESYKQFKKGNRGSRVTSYNIIERGDYNIYLIENFPCDNKDELARREGELIKQMKNGENVVNKTIPGRTNAEYHIDNAEQIKNRKHLYYEENIIKLKAEREEKYKCICGSTICRPTRKRHERLAKHMNFIESNSKLAN
jgi:hypothetical protein